MLKPGNLNGSRVCVIPPLRKFLQLVVRGSPVPLVPGPWALGPWALVPLPLVPGPLGPCPWALGPLPLVPGPLGPFPLGPGPLSLGPWALGPWVSHPNGSVGPALSPQPPYQPLGWSYRYCVLSVDTFLRPRKLDAGPLGPWARSSGQWTLAPGTLGATSQQLECLRDKWTRGPLDPWTRGRVGTLRRVDG